MRIQVPRRVDALAELFSSYPGVVGVGWGQARRGGRFTEETALAVHVQHKREPEQVPMDEWLDSEFDRVALDIIEVGRPRVHVLDHTDASLTSAGARARSATVTALAAHGGGVLALLSGHASLPWAQGQIRRSFVEGQPADELRIVDGEGGFYRGRVMKGRFGDGLAVDWGLAEIPDVKERNTFHLAAGEGSPLKIRRTALSFGERVWHFSRLESPGRRRRISGRFRQLLTTPTEFRLPDGTSTTYRSILVIESPLPVAFSLEGDSGSLVVDDGGEVVGTVLGASADYSLAYVARVDALTEDLAQTASIFFT